LRSRSIFRRACVATAFLGLFALVALVPGTAANHVRPKAATPKYDSLVIAYKPIPPSCPSPLAHGSPAVLSACAPDDESNSLAVGTPDNNGAAANFTGSQKLALTGSGASTDVLLTFSATDIRCKPGTAMCTNANTVDGPDYVGPLQVALTLRITDDFNGPVGGPPGTDSATVTDIVFPYDVPCVVTSVSIGSTCARATSMNAIVPGSASSEATRRANVAVEGSVRVNDAGPDANTATPDNTLFLRSGLFVP
jgi:hypothetical protein